MWVRDYAFSWSRRSPTVVDRYPQQESRYEDNFSDGVCATFGMHYNHCGLTLHGGNPSLSNGDGVCVTTLRIIARIRTAAITQIKSARFTTISISSVGSDSTSSKASRPVMPTCSSRFAR